jgi:hypothetical protein
MNYTAENISNFFNEHESMVTHNLVAHTKFRPYLASNSKIDAMAEEAKRNLRYALNVFSKSLYPNQSNLIVRKPEIYRPLSLVTIENIKETTDEEQTIHFNISLGNLPKHFNTTYIEILFRHAWHVKAKQSNDIYLTHKNDYPANPQKWFGYIVKDANKCGKLAWDTNGTWDVLNTWIPSNAINTD